MLILDKTLAMDRMVAQASRVAVPEEFSLSARAGEQVRGGFRVATYGPIEREPVKAQRWTWELAMARLAG